MVFTSDGGATCTNYCCNPDGREDTWCFVESESCEGNEWGYCAPERLIGRLAYEAVVSNYGSDGLISISGKWGSGCDSIAKVELSYLGFDTAADGPRACIDGRCERASFLKAILAHCP